jgi:hypothetical protein
MKDANLVRLLGYFMDAGYRCWITGSALRDFRNGPDIDVMFPASVYPCARSRPLRDVPYAFTNAAGRHPACRYARAVDRQTGQSDPGQYVETPDEHPYCTLQCGTIRLNDGVFFEKVQRVQ